MRSCDRCGKGLQVGMNVSHAHNKTKKKSYPNLHSLRTLTGQGSSPGTFCTKCIRIVRVEQANLRAILAKKKESFVKVEKKKTPEVRVPEKIEVEEKEIPEKIKEEKVKIERIKVKKIEKEEEKSADMLDLEKELLDS